jgi:transposase-like protein
MSKRRKWSAEDKLRIVPAGMKPGLEVSDLCRQEGINPTMYYYRREQKGSGVNVFAGLSRVSTDGPRAADSRLQAQTFGRLALPRLRAERHAAGHAQRSTRSLCSSLATGNALKRSW